MKIGDYVKVQVYDCDDPSDDPELVYAIGKLEHYDKKSKLWDVVDLEGKTGTLQSPKNIQVLTKDEAMLFMLEL